MKTKIASCLILATCLLGTSYSFAKGGRELSPKAKLKAMVEGMGCRGDIEFNYKNSTITIRALNLIDEPVVFSLVDSGRYASFPMLDAVSPNVILSSVPGSVGWSGYPNTTVKTVGGTYSYECNN